LATQIGRVSTNAQRQLGRWTFVLVLAVSACAPPEATPDSLTPTLPPPRITTALPDPPEVVAQRFLKAWEAGDTLTMYGQLSPAGQGAMNLEAFRDRYRTVSDALGATRVQAVLLDTTTEGRRSQVAFRVTFTTALHGGLTRESSLTLSFRDGRWSVDWSQAAILPELEGGNTLYVDHQLPERGSLYDRSGRALVAVSDWVAVGVVPGQMTEGSALVDRLAPLLGLKPEVIEARIASAQSDWYVPLGEFPVGEAQPNLDGLSDLAGVVATPLRTRYYFGGLAPQALGYLAPLSPETLAAYTVRGYPGDARVGAAGLEQTQEARLSGRPGGAVYLVSPGGEIITRLVEAPVTSAEDVYTTLDFELQQAAQAALGDLVGAIVVLQPETGEVLALASTPGYDSNLFDPANPNSVMLPAVLGDARRPLFNRVTQGQYPLGSVFKIVTMAAALETGGYTPESQLDCTYEWTGLGPDYPKYDWKEAGHGVLTLVEGLIESCDTWFYDLGLALDGRDPALLPQFARAFGLGAPAGLVDLPDAPGLVPDPDWKLKATGVPWWPGDAVNLAIGQGDLLVTPLQVARLVAAVANGGTLYRPQLVHHVAPPDGPPSFEFSPEADGQLPISGETLAALQTALLGVTQHPKGTAFQRFRGLGIPVAGKTGTAQAPGATSLPHSWFAGYTLADRRDRPDIAIAVLVENAGEGSAVAAPIFRRLVETYFEGRPRTRFPWESAIGVPAEPKSTPTPDFAASETPPP